MVLFSSMKLIDEIRKYNAAVCKASLASPSRTIALDISSESI